MIKNKLKADFMKAMREKNKSLKLVVSEIRGAIQVAETSKGRKTGEADDTEILSIIKKCAKECKESLEAFKKAGTSYEVQVNELNTKLVLLESYLPQNASQEQLQEAVTNAITFTGATTMREMGSVMKEARTALTELGMGIDGKALSDIVKASLS